ncbi:MAG: carboxypeptidase-like regulatory domain-containing protein, partial [Bacteroidetes bacterium]|nr:carboxypeptidase-like regulatory domain-containing protein [Bacteroidota bacterium]
MEIIINNSTSRPMKKKLFVIFMQLVFCLIVTHAQTKTITGTVSHSEDGNPVTGVTVEVSGTTISTVTDENGNYSITVPEYARVLLFTFTGMKTVEEPIGDWSVIDAILEPD